MTDEGTSKADKDETDTSISTWREYWVEQYEEGAQRQLATAIREPLNGWLLIDVGAVLATDIGVTFEDIRYSPDEVVAAAREGFEGFLREETEGADAQAYQHTPVHFVGLSPVARTRQLPLEDPLSQVAHLTTIPDTTISNLDTGYRAIRRTFVCPAGHETTLCSPLYQSRALTRCGESDCSNEVYVDDSQTYVQPVVTFEVVHGDTTLECVGTGLYAHEPQRLDAKTFDLTGIPRVRTSSDGAVTLVFELSNVARKR